MPPTSATQHGALAPPSPNNLTPTPILDSAHEQVRAARGRILQGPTDPLDAGAFLRRAHEHVRSHVLPVYTLNEDQPASTTLRLGKGSCSQRLACLEAIARSHRIPTRVDALWLSGAMWYPRFSRPTRAFMPHRVLLAWPSFWIGRWLPVDELFGPTAELARRSPQGFRNDGETLFEAVANTPVDFHGKTRTCGVACDPQADLSRFVLQRQGPYDSRDALFDAHPSLQHTIRGRIFEALWGGRKSH